MSSRLKDQLINQEKWTDETIVIVLARYRKKLIHNVGCMKSLDVELKFVNSGIKHEFFSGELVKELKSSDVKSPAKGDGGSWLLHRCVGWTLQDKSQQD